MSQVYKRSLSLRTLDEFYINVGLLRLVSDEIAAAAEEMNENVSSDRILTFDHSTALIRPGERVENYPVSLVRVYEPLADAHGRLTLDKVTPGLTTVALDRHTVLDQNGIVAYAATHPADMVLKAHYFVVPGVGQLDVIAARGEYHDDPLDLVELVPNEIVPKRLKRRVLEAYDKYSFKEMLSQEELEAMNGIDNDYHNWLFMNALLAAAAITQRQAATMMEQEVMADFDKQVEEFLGLNTDISREQFEAMQKSYVANLVADLDENAGLDVVRELVPEIAPLDDEKIMRVWTFIRGIQDKAVASRSATA